MLAIASPYPRFFDLTGAPMSGGSLYFGSPNQNPETAQITVYWDSALTQPALQPVPTLNGYASRNGSPGMLFSASDYSITARDKAGQIVFYAPTSADYSLASALAAYQAALAATTAGNGAALVGFKYDASYVQNTIGAAMVDGVINALWFVTSESRRQSIKTRTFANDNTAEAQAALDFGGKGSTVLFPGGWRINGTLTRYAGQFIVGNGWRDAPGTYNIEAGSELKQYNLTDIPMITLDAANDSVNAARGGLVDIALTTATGGQTVGTGFRATNCRQLRFRNVYTSGFNVGIELASNCWQARMEQTLHFDHAKCLYVHDEGGEDSTYTGVICRSYRSTGWGVHLKNMCQSATFVGCDFSQNQLGLFLDQGDTNGNGTGTPYPMTVAIIGCQFEDCSAAAIRTNSTGIPNSTNFWPSVVVSGQSRAYNVNTPNAGQTFVDAVKAHRIEVTGLSANGYSYGVAAQSVTEVILDNPTSAWGTAEVSGQTYKVFGPTRTRPICQLTANALSYVATNFTRVPFDVSASDTEVWYAGGTTSITPKRAVRMRFRAQIYTTTAAVGRYRLMIYKNGASLVGVFDQYVSTAGQPLTMAGETFDTPNGTTDYYTVYVYSTASFTLNTAECAYSAEACL